MAMINVLIVDDHTVVRAGLKQILSETSDIRVQAETSRGYKALSVISETDLNVVILDISLPDGNGLEFLKQIKSAQPNLPVLILSMYSEEQYAVRALKAGAAGYLTKESASEELINAIRKIARGRKYITPLLAEKLAVELDSDFNQLPHEKLSNREYQVMRLLGQGKTAKNIAENLFLSEKTISTYRSRILTKMKLKNNAEIIYYAVKHKLVE